MLHHHRPVHGRKLRGSLYEIGVLVSICASVVTFFVGSFAEHVGVRGFELALLYAVGSFISIGSFVCLPWFVHLMGALSTLLTAATLYTLGVFGTALAYSFYTLLIPFTLVSLTFGVILALLDMYVEHSTDKTHTEGEVRGTYLAVQNGAFIVGPLVGGLVLTMGGYTALFLSSALFMIPVLGIVYERLGTVTPPPPAHSEHRSKTHAHIHHAGFSLENLTSLWRNRQLRDTYFFYLLLRIFFAIFGIYTALFLSHVHEFSYAAIGTLIAISLIPMAVVEMPVGRLLDSSWHHGHVGMVGFGILALTSGLVPFIESSEFLVWALVLFTMRIGASLVEIVAETYFFSLAGSDPKKVGLFRATYPLSFILGPACGALALSLGGYNGLFTFLSLLSLVGAYVASEFKK